MYTIYTNQLKEELKRVKCIAELLPFLLQRNMKGLFPPSPGLSRQDAYSPPHLIFRDGHMATAPRYLFKIRSVIESGLSKETKINHLIAANRAWCRESETHLGNLTHTLMSRYYELRDVCKRENLVEEGKEIEKKIDSFCRLLIDGWHISNEIPLFEIGKKDLVLLLSFNCERKSELIALVLSEKELLALANGEEGYHNVRKEIDDHLDIYRVSNSFRHYYANVAHQIKWVANYLWFLRMLPAIHLRYRNRFTVENIICAMYHFFSSEETIEFIEQARIIPQNLIIGRSVS